MHTSWIRSRLNFISLSSLALWLPKPIFPKARPCFFHSLYHISSFHFFSTNSSSATASTPSPLCFLLNPSPTSTTLLKLVSLPNLPSFPTSVTGHYYAVRKGRQPGIYATHQEFEAQVQRYSNNEGQRFSSFQDALKYLLPTFSKTTFFSSTEVFHRTSLPSAFKMKPLSSPNYIEQLYYLNAAIHPAPLPNTCLRVYTDGSCKTSGSNIRAGIGAYIEEGHPCNQSAPFQPLSPDDTPTSNKAEIQAVTSVLSRLPSHLDIEIRTDSLHVIRGLTSFYQTSHSIPATIKPKLPPYTSPKDVEHFQLLAHHIQRRSGKVFFVHVKAHQGVHENEMADRLAKLGADASIATSSSLPISFTASKSYLKHFSRETIEEPVKKER